MTGGKDAREEKKEERRGSSDRELSDGKEKGKEGKKETAELRGLSQESTTTAASLTLSWFSFKFIYFV